MTSSLTRSASYTITDARYVGAKIGANMRTLHALYGKPSPEMIDKYVEEVALLLKNGYLKTVDYGFKDRDSEVWKLRLRYRAVWGARLADDNPSGVPRSANVTGLRFGSYLTYSTSFLNLPQSERGAFEKMLPFSRTTAAETPLGLGSSSLGRSYGRNGVGVSQDVFVASDI
ncbi:hypothetical protein ACOBQX_07780 [Actinokineospora sp. G85]|uniref:HORMA-1 domain-containing protein n=1 Tax=Actinokineospora sp. G85 TaxID=3406626 RepID=UPI003C78E5F0